MSEVCLILRGSFVTCSLQSVFQKRLFHWVQLGGLSVFQNKITHRAYVAGICSRINSIFMSL